MLQRPNDMQSAQRYSRLARYAGYRVSYPEIQHIAVQACDFCCSLESPQSLLFIFLKTPNGRLGRVSLACQNCRKLVTNLCAKHNSNEVKIRRNGLLCDLGLGCLTLGYYHAHVELCCWCGESFEDNVMCWQLTCGRARCHVGCKDEAQEVANSRWVTLVAQLFTPCILLLGECGLNRDIITVVSYMLCSSFAATNNKYWTAIE